MHQCSQCVLTLLGESMCRGGGHPWAWELGGTVWHMGWWCRTVNCRGWWQHRCWTCRWAHMICQRPAGRWTHGSRWTHWWGSCVTLPSWSHRWLLWVWVVARRNSWWGRGCMCRGQSRARAGAGRVRRAMGWRISNGRSGQQWLARRGWVRSEWGARLVGADRGGRLVGPSGVQSGTWGCRSFGLQWIVSWLVSHTVAESWRLLQASWILWWTCRRDGLLGNLQVNSYLFSTCFSSPKQHKSAAFIIQQSHEGTFFDSLWTFSVIWS